jgi:hypothetical protein
MMKTPWSAWISGCCGLLAVAFLSGVVWAQAGSQGTVVVVVADQSGGALPDTSLQLIDPSTNDVRVATTKENGAYTFVNLSIGHYRLTASHAGFQTAVVNDVEVHAALTTDVPVTLRVGASTETVTVSATASSLVEASSNVLGTIVDMKQIEDLPITGRDLTSLARLTPGYVGDHTSGGGGQGSWNGQPLISQGSNIDGTIGQSSRMKIFGNAEPAVVPRIEDIEEMTVQTDQLDLDQGFGQAIMQINFVTRRGSNDVHGRLFENFHNNGLNANSWANNTRKVRRPKSIYNDFGGSVGGHILKDKLFYFGSFALRYVPGGSTVSNDQMLTSDAAAGNFTYTDTTGTNRTVNLLSVASAYSSSLPGSINSLIAAQIKNINSAASAGEVTQSNADPNLQSITWFNDNTQKTFYPSVRVDYNATKNVRMNLVWSMTEDLQPGLNRAPFPGSTFSNLKAGNKTKTYTSSYGVDWMISPELINQFKFGFLYNTSLFSYNASQGYKDPKLGMINWALGDSGVGLGDYQLPITSYYPAFNASDVVTLQKSKHTLKFGFTGYREQDHYWNAPSGFPVYQLGLVSGDPAINAFTNGPGGTLPNASNQKMTEAQNLYATLVGRISSVSGSYAYNSSTKDYARKLGSYALDEVSTAWGLFAQDSYKLTPTLTLNYGLRWDFTGASTDKTGLYHSSDTSSVFGPTAPGDLFKPGTLNGNNNPMLTARPRSFDPFHVTPQPAFGIAWNPQTSEGLMGKLLGKGKTVIRAGFSLRRFTEPYQYYWNNASDQGSFYYQNFNYNGSVTGVQGTFAPGSLSLGDTRAADPTNYSYLPASYQASIPVSSFTFLGNAPGGSTPGVTGIYEHIQQPYTETWNFGIQRGLGSRVLEIRYAGNRTLHQWVNNNTNEINIFENGFLDEFKKAQANLQAYRASNPDCDATSTCSFANNGLSGQSDLPILNAAFTGEDSGGTGIPMVDYANSSFVSDLDSGQAGALAQALTGVGTTNYFCNLVGSSFAPCLTNGGYAGGAGAGKPINFFQANPYATGQETQYMVASGYSNYNALQVEMRQQQWQGLQFDLNYTWSHTLGYQVNPNGRAASGYPCGYYGYSGWCGWPGTITLRNTRLPYGPSQFDIRHAIHLTGTYDLPIGKGKALLNGNNLADSILGNWTVGFLATFQTGTPDQVIGNNLTFNDYGDGGVVLNNVTVKQLQNAVGVHRVPGKVYALLIDPKYLQNPNGTGGANPAYIASNTTPGTIKHPIYLYGPHAFYNDLSLSKTFPIFREFKMKIQAEATNAWNHPVFGNTSGSFGGAPNYSSGNIQNSGWATSGVTNGARVIEFRANVEF